MSQSTSSSSLSAALTAKQAEDLNSAILGYLRSSGWNDIADQFSAVSGATFDTLQPDALAKKWKSVLRLQKKVLELEAQVKELSEAGKGKKVDNSESLPRSTPKFVLSGHKKAVTSVQFHPNFTTLASASEDSSIKLWDYESGKFERSLTGHTDAIQDITYSPSGHLLASCSNDMSIKVWDVQDSFQCVKTLNGHDHTVSAVSFLPSGEALVSASRDERIKLWELSSGFCTRTYTGHEGWVRCVRVSPNGITMASGSSDQTVRVWNIKSGECVSVLKGHEHVVEAVAFSNAAADAVLRKAFNKPASHTETTTPESKEPVGGAFLASASRDKTINIWDLTTGSLMFTVKAHDNWVTAVMFHPSGRYLLSAGDDKSVRVFDMSKEFREVRRLQTTHFVSSVDWNKSPPMLACGVVDNTIPVYACGSLI